jgi:hypothetical protein
MDWVCLAQARDKWWAVVNMVMNLWALYKVWRISRVAEELSASQEGFCFMELNSV